MKNFRDTIGLRTRDFQTCSAMPLYRSVYHMHKTALQAYHEPTFPQNMHTLILGRYLKIFARQEMLLNSDRGLALTTLHLLGSRWRMSWSHTSASCVCQGNSCVERPFTFTFCYLQIAFICKGRDRNTDWCLSTASNETLFSVTRANYLVTACSLTAFCSP